MFLVNKESTVTEEFDLTISKCSVWTETNCKNNHIHIKCFFISDQAFNFSFTFDSFNSLTKCQTDVVVFQVFSHHLCEVFVIVSVQYSVNDINKYNFFSKTFESFSKLNTDVTTTYNSDTLKVFALVSKFVDNFFCVLVQFNELYVFKSCFELTVTFNDFNAFDWWQDWS
ncbi:Uncharacterised protein [Mycobacteroides abscessus subsp. abscessus]|nr:Uncharacterised protein [Mycobacteroides abscessus subsp. abscessus]